MCKEIFVDMYFLKLLLFLFLYMLWQINKELNIGKESQSTMSQLMKKFHVNVDVQKKGSLCEGVLVV